MNRSRNSFLRRARIRAAIFCWRRGVARRARDASGSVAVEFALLIPVYIAFMFGTIEFGRMIWIRNTMEFAAEQAARYGAITSGATTATITAYAATQLIGISSTGITFTVPTLTSTTVQVRATYNFTTLISAYVPIPATTLTVNATFAK
jgi:Flp pilus assembly protein TadG